MRCYTQNIDCIEQHINLKLGINLQEFDNNKFKQVWNQLDVVQLHGNLHKLSCTNCFSQFNWNEEFQTLLAMGSIQNALNAWTNTNKDYTWAKD